MLKLNTKVGINYLRFMSYFNSRIKNLLLADPWGYGKLPEITPLDPEYVSPRTGQKTSLLIRLLAQILLSFNPLALYRFFGRLSLYILSRLRSDLSKPYDALWKNKNDNVLLQYAHYCILQNPRYRYISCFIRPIRGMLHYKIIALT